MRNNCIDLSIRDKKVKKKHCELIFMPKFLLNVINLTKKAEKIHKKQKPSKKDDLILDFKTTFSHMPKINLLSYKESRNAPNNNISKKYKYISLFQNHESLIIKQSFPQINIIDSISFDNKNKINEVKKFYELLKKSKKINKTNSCLNMNFSRNKNLLLEKNIVDSSRNNFFLTRNYRRNSIEKELNKNSHFNKTIIFNKKYNNYNKDSYINNKFQKCSIFNRENRDINELHLQKEKNKKEKDWNLYKTNINFSSKIILLSPNNFQTKENIINSYSDKNSSCINYSFNISPNLNIDNTTNIS